MVEETERWCDARLQFDPDQPRVLYLRARLALRQGREDFALACLLRAVSLDPTKAEYLNDLGELWQRKRRQPEALAAYIQALRLTPGDPDRYEALGRALCRQGLHAEAAAVYERALRLDPNRADVHVALGDVRYAQHAAAQVSEAGSDSDEASDVGAAAARDDQQARAPGPGPGPDDVSRAVAHYQRAIEIDGTHADAYRGLARVHGDRGEWAQALACVQEGARAGARSVDLYVDEGELRLRAGEPQLAIDPLRAALDLHPRHLRAGRLLIEALERLERREDLVGAWFSLGAALEIPGPDQHLAEAVRAFEAAVAIKPDCLRALLKLGDLALKFRDPRRAMACFEAAVAIDPAHPVAHVNLGWALRIAGEFTRGWKESAWNYAAGERRRFEQPMWDGSPLGGRRLLLWAEFALGDTIQDLRYLPLVASAAGAAGAAGAASAAGVASAQVIVECDNRLVSLVDRLRVPGISGDGVEAGMTQVVAFRAPLPAFDVQLPLRRVPEVLGIELGSIPARTPYLFVDPDRAAFWRARLDAGRGAIERPVAREGQGDARDIETYELDERDVTVGLVWAGDATRTDARIKSASLIDFEPLVHVDGVRFVSLQLGPGAAELVAPPPGLRVERVLDDSCDAGDTAAVMQALDLIITVDTMTAHLAGAIGKPVWVLAAHSPAWWLWHVEGDRSLWYPTMRLFRQERAGDWEGVLKRVAEALERFVLEKDLED